MLAFYCRVKAILIFCWDLCQHLLNIFIAEPMWKVLCVCLPIFFSENYLSKRVELIRDHYTLSLKFFIPFLPHFRDEALVCLEYATNLSWFSCSGAINVNGSGCINVLHETDLNGIAIFFRSEVLWRAFLSDSLPTKKKHLIFFSFFWNFCWCVWEKPILLEIMTQV